MGIWVIWLTGPACTENSAEGMIWSTDRAAMGYRKLEMHQHTP
jgi:hypothetical protein